MYSVIAKPGYVVYLKDVELLINSDRKVYMSNRDWELSGHLQEEYQRGNLVCEYIDDSESSNYVKSVYFVGGNTHFQYPWNGSIVLVQANSPVPVDEDILFCIEKQTKEDYQGQLNNWIMLGEQLTLINGSVYGEYQINDEVNQNDMLRVRYVNNENQTDGITIQLRIKNKINSIT